MHHLLLHCSCTNLISGHFQSSVLLFHLMICLWRLVLYVCLSCKLDLLWHTLPHLPRLSCISNTHTLLLNISTNITWGCFQMSHLIRRIEICYKLIWLEHICYWLRLLLCWMYALLPIRYRMKRRRCSKLVLHSCGSSFRDWGRRNVIAKLHLRLLHFIRLETYLLHSCSILLLLGSSTNGDIAVIGLGWLLLSNVRLLIVWVLC